MRKGEAMSSFTTFNGSIRSILSDTGRRPSFDEIPIISLAVPRDQLIREIRDACTRVGFFYICDHGVPQALIDQAFAVGKEFFHQSKDQKSKVHIDKSKAHRGWEPMLDTWVDDSLKPDRKETYCWGYEVSLDPDVKMAPGEDGKYLQKLSISAIVCGDGNAMAADNIWPNTIPVFQPVITEYYGMVLRLARHLIRVFALALDLEENYFDAMVARPGALGNIVYYPSQPPTQRDIGISPHTDFELLTILCQSDQEGLQILNPNHEWILAPPIPGTFVVNIGDMLQRWSNDIFVSTAHRVINMTGQERYSIPLFFGPHYDTIIEPLPSCVSEDRPAKYKPIQAGQYVYERLEEARYRKIMKQNGVAVKRGTWK